MTESTRALAVSAVRLRPAGRSLRARRTARGGAERGRRHPSSTRGPTASSSCSTAPGRKAQVVFYAALIVNQAMRPIADGFSKKYPFVKMTTWRADSEDIVQKVAAEVRANNVVADVIEGTGARRGSRRGQYRAALLLARRRGISRRNIAIPTDCGRRRG